MLPRQTNCIIFGLILLFLLIFYFSFFDIYIVPTNSMANTIESGDRILIKDYRLTRKINETKVKIYDVIIFRSPHGQPKLLVKRCMALPKDTIILKLDTLTFKNKATINISLNSYILKVYYNNQRRITNLIDSLGIEPEDRHFFPDHLEIPRKSLENSKLYQSSFIDSIRLSRILDDNSFSLASNKFINSIDKECGIIVPYKGCIIKRDNKNFEIYNQLFSRYENDSLLIFNNFLSDTCLIFTNDYYFVLGDNLNNSSDSREWGFIPNRLITGKAILVLLSIKDEEKIVKGLKFKSIMFDYKQRYSY